MVTFQHLRWIIGTCDVNVCSVAVVRLVMLVSEVRGVGGCWRLVWSFWAVGVMVIVAFGRGAYPQGWWSLLEGPRGRTWRVHERVRLEKPRSVEEDWKSQEGLPKDQDGFFPRKGSNVNLSQATSPEEAPL